MSDPIVKCGDCKYFVRDGKCQYLQTAEGRAKDRPFAHAPFWVWSDCYSDREQVRANVTSACPTFAPKVAKEQGAEASHSAEPQSGVATPPARDAKDDARHVRDYIGKASL